MGVLIVRDGPSRDDISTRWYFANNLEEPTILLRLCQNRTKPITIVNQRPLFQFRCARTSVLTMIIATRTSNSNSAYADIRDEIDANNKN